MLLVLGSVKSPCDGDLVILEIFPEAPWDVMGCQVATCFKALFGVS